MYLGLPGVIWPLAKRRFLYDTLYRAGQARCEWTLVPCSAEVRARQKEPFIDSMHTYVVCYATNLLITYMDTLRTIRPSTSPTRPFVRYQIVQFLKTPNTQTTRIQTTWCGVWSGRDPFRIPCENYVLIYPHVWEKKIESRRFWVFWYQCLSVRNETPPDLDFLLSCIFFISCIESKLFSTFVYHYSLNSHLQ